MAHVEFEFRSEGPESVGACMRTLARIARDASFELERAKVEPLSEDHDRDDRDGWTQYAP